MPIFARLLPNYVEKDSANYLRQQCNGFPNIFFLFCRVLILRVWTRLQYCGCQHKHKRKFLILSSSYTLFLQLIIQYSKDRININFTFCQYHTTIQLMLPNDLRFVNMFIRKLRVTSVVVEGRYTVNATLCNPPTTSLDKSRDGRSGLVTFSIICQRFL